MTDDRNQKRMVVLAGAGASRNLGINGSMPLMKEWSESLSDALDAEWKGLANRLGLRGLERGDQFEAKLGQLFAFREALSICEPYIELGAKENGAVPTNIYTWFTECERRCIQVEDVLQRNLYDNFGRDKVDGQAAAHAYGSLCDRLRENYFFDRVDFATTNYDAAIEEALTLIQVPIDDGFVSHGTGTPTLELSNFVNRLGDATGVLHLHGAVGWYQAEDEIERWPTNKPLNTTLGVPAILPPDDRKALGTLAGWASEVFEAFAELVSNASHVLILGHSLNDSHLTEVLGDVSANVAVTHVVGATEAEIDALSSRLPNASVFGYTFGPNPDLDVESFNRFLRRDWDATDSV